MTDDTLSQGSVDGKLTDYSACLRDKARHHAKRLFDLCAAFAMIIILLPIYCLIVILIIVGGQVPLYSHVRVGRGGREFGCLKFRSMRRDADIVLSRLLEDDPAAKLEWEVNRKLRYDPRITRLGHWLRATSLDELPQLLNVLAGQMSLVGPRPVTRDELTEFYGPSDAAAYCSVRPGLTGLWQVSGRSETGYDNRVALDTLYVKRLSLRRDLIILFQTISIVVRQRGAW
jgi:lipopolysaccharide/colanic/teichoic acid biosynthesis glycosyltransferase